MSLNPTILVIDDMEADRELIKEHLIEDDIMVCNFVEAASLEEGLSKYTEHTPSCVVLDFFLPDGKATEFLEKVRKDNIEHSPIIMISGNISKELTFESYEGGAACVFDKNSLDPRILRGLVQHMIIKNHSKNN